MAHALELKDIRIALGARPLLAVDARLEDGDIITVMGPSGSGKSTLLSYIAGFLDPVFTAAGRVVLDGEDVTERAPEARHVGLLFQDPLLFPHLSVGGNLMFGLPKGAADRRAVVADALARFDLAGYEGRDPATLSGGQKARVALLRLLLSEPRAVLLDEPFSKLDRGLRAEVRGFVFDRLRQAGLPTVLVTHDHEDAEAAGGHLVIL